MVMISNFLISIWVCFFNEIALIMFIDFHFINYIVIIQNAVTEATQEMLVVLHFMQYFY